jgi:hypothetical protein
MREKKTKRLSWKFDSKGMMDPEDKPEVHESILLRVVECMIDAPSE